MKFTITYNQYSKKDVQTITENLTDLSKEIGLEAEIIVRKENKDSNTRRATVQAEGFDTPTKAVEYCKELKLKLATENITFAFSAGNFASQNKEQNHTR